MSKLFEEFEGVSAKAWKQKIHLDLKGADYNDTLIWQSPEGIHVKPFYHPDDFEGRFDDIPGHPKKWEVVQDVFIDDENTANSLAKDALNRGAEAIFFTADKVFDRKKVFKGIDFSKGTIYFDLRFLNKEFHNELMTFLTEKKACVFYNIDLIGNLARTGNWYTNLKEDHIVLDQLVEKFPSEALLSVDAALYQNAGANIVQQLAYAIAHANEYLNHFQDKKDLLINFKTAAGNNYFFEIAKLRALRKLYSVLGHEYEMNPVCNILSTPSRRNKTIYDYNVNMLRSTTECMSAILGGANAISNLSYDTIYQKSNEFGERISRNQLLILKSESYFDAVSNPADGTYYIESLTAQLAESALKLFKEIEAGGGFLKLLKEGTIQRKIKESARKEQQLFDDGELVLLGTNKHPNPADLMKETLELYPFVKMKPRKTLIEPVIEKRLADSIEKERLENENQI
ncbi:MAG: methylmalonyl-CoA mutase subunit beta [Bacteroidia bacterium]|nr:methylmalonyl-CoA mutase subunit beta [Bacteroidia bacterium]MBT8275001.1 methylmalonyl-CoA mutase subunit beta [Bacteroidia bacterium]NNJ80578.1 methylmalonyl-CoA mutase [Flavobacteriaceae bacterium]NNK55513.1 methylmalonyl-CoA mutase [Flavobacteriaceae bacterium]NNM08125.1 methylmalonyl-CoA mutase [Flavobacteriaceae bacterium]